MTAKSLIDLDHLEKYVAGDYALRDEVLAIFVNQVGALIGGMSITQTDEDWRNTAHAVKGAARGVGAWTLGDLCEEAEALVGDASAKRERRSSLLIAMRQQLSESVSEVRRLAEASQAAKT